MNPENPATARFSRRSLLAASAAGAAALAPNAVFPTGAPTIAAQPSTTPGELLWSYQTGDWQRRHNSDYKGIPAVLHRSPRLFALDPNTGDHVWVHRVGDSSVLFVDDHIYLRRNGYARIDPESGADLWSIVAESWPAIEGEVAYFGGREGIGYAVDANTGRERWSFSAGSGFRQLGQPVASGNTVYFKEAGGTIFAVDTVTGLERWRLETNTSTSLVAAFEDALLIRGYDGRDYHRSLDAQTGAERWRRNIRSTIDVVNGAIYSVDGESGSYRLTSVDPATGTVRWSIPAETTSWTTPIVSDGTLYIGGGNGYIYMLDEASGEEWWSFAATRILPPQPVLHEGVLYFGGLGGAALAVDAANGAIRWTSANGDSIPSPILSNGTIVWFYSGSNIVWLDPESGEERWRFVSALELESSPLVVEGSLYVGSRDNNVYALDATTGSERWRFQTRGEIVATPAIRGNALFVPSGDGHLYALETETGAEQWRFRTIDGINTSPVIANHLVYLAGGGHHAYALDPETGNEEWRFDADDEVRFPPMVRGWSVFVTTVGGTLYEIGATSGYNAWWFYTGDVVYLEHAASDGLVFLANDRGWLYAVSGLNGHEQWSARAEFGFSTPPVVVDDRIYIGTPWDGLFAIDADSGNGIWNYAGSDLTAIGSGFSTTPVVSDGIVIICAFDVVTAVTANGGFELWSITVNAAVNVPPVVSRGTVYLAASWGRIVAVDLRTGVEHWRYDIGESVSSSPTVAENMLYVSCWDGAVYAFAAVPPPVTAGAAANVVAETTVYADADASSAELTTLQAGVQVYVSGESVWVDGIVWWPVIAPDGSIGWVEGSALRGEF